MSGSTGWASGRRSWAASVALVACCVAVLGVSGCDGSSVAAPSVATRPAGVQGPLPVVRVTDGDTIVVRRGHRLESVRLIGVDTPETKRRGVAVQCYGPEAARFTTSLLTGREVWLERDRVAGDRDRYGRTLSYVWLGAEDLVNLLLISGGHGRQYAFDGQKYRYRTVFEASERVARAAGRGMWSSCR